MVVDALLNAGEGRKDLQRAFAEERFGVVGGAALHRFESGDAGGEIARICRALEFIDCGLAGECGPDCRCGENHRENSKKWEAGPRRHAHVESSHADEKQSPV